MELELRPIGRVRSPFTERKQAPRQPRAARGVEGTIELYPGRGLEDAVVDLGSFSHLWVIFWFHLNEGWRPKVSPPRDHERRGVLATRAPRRPNPIGLSVVRLDRVEGLVLHVRDVDMLDGTPVLDIKPYVPYTDAIPDASHGWLERSDPRPAWDVAFTPEAAEQLDWLAREHGVELRAPLRDKLALGPQPHAYRRIRREEDGFTIAFEAWRARFRIEGQRVLVERVRTGYRPRQLASDPDPALHPHRALVARYGS